MPQESIGEGGERRKEGGKSKSEIKDSWIFYFCALIPTTLKLNSPFKIRRGKGKRGERGGVKRIEFVRVLLTKLSHASLHQHYKILFV